MTPESLSKVSSALTDLFTVEATLKEHFYVDGRYVDQYVLALTASRWKEVRASFLPQICLGVGEPPAPVVLPPELS